MNITRTTIESALRLLLHARNSRGSLRSVIRLAVHADVLRLRSMAA